MYFFWSPYNRPPRAQRGRRGIALLIRNLGARRGWVVSTTPRPLYPRERPGTHLQEAGWALGPVWTCAKNLAPTGIFLLHKSRCTKQASIPGTSSPYSVAIPTKLPGPWLHCMVFWNVWYLFIKCLFRWIKKEELRNRKFCMQEATTIITRNFITSKYIDRNP
jgi:hypothetical protein